MRMDSLPARALSSALTTGTSSLGAPPELAVKIRMTENRLWRLASGCCAILVGVLCAGCGGGTAGGVLPPASPDFVISILPSSATVSQGANSSGMQASIQALNGFSGDVQITFSGTPSGLTANPQSPFSVQSGGSATLLLGVSPSAAIGNASISADGASGSLSHCKIIALSVQRRGLPTAGRLRPSLARPLPLLGFLQLSSA
jgi:hypothetical protein